MGTKNPLFFCFVDYITNTRDFFENYYYSYIVITILYLVFPLQDSDKMWNFFVASLSVIIDKDVH